MDAPRSALPPLATESNARSALRDLVPLALVIVTLLGSLAIPALQTWRITGLLRETTQVLAPARLLVEQLQSGLTSELVALQSYALSGDTMLLVRQRVLAAADDQRLATLAQLAPRLDPAAAAGVGLLERNTNAWRAFSDTLLEQGWSGAPFGAELRQAQPRYDASLSAAVALSLNLAAGATARDDRVRALERLSIVSNAVLVLTALVAMSGVLALTLRQRRLSSMLLHRAAREVALRRAARRRARREAALRAAAEALAGAYTIDEVTQRIVSAALEAMPGRGAFIEQIGARAGELSADVTVRAVAGDDVPALDTTSPLAGSYTELVTTDGKSRLISNLGRPAHSGTLWTLQSCAGSAVVVPLGAPTSPVGALFVVSSARHRFHARDVTRAEIFGHLAALAYEKVALLEDARERQRVVERVLQSRSRLIRGFSHDVKNSVGAADGLAELLSIGVYGEIPVEPLASIERLRRCLHGAIALIDDLHELGRAETGNVVLSFRPVDLAEVVRALAEEYHAAAQRGGLSLSVAVDPDVPIIETDVARLRQIAANLLSNAIKYTAHGSVLVRARRQPAAGACHRDGDWVLLDVTDSGAGIPADKQDYIFEEFSRLQGSAAPGAGLGLAISKLLAQALGGDISVSSRLGYGSTFTLWLPLHVSAPA